MEADQLCWIIGGYNQKDHPVIFTCIETAYYYNKYELLNDNPDIIVEVVLDQDYFFVIIRYGQRVMVILISS